MNYLFSIRFYLYGKKKSQIILEGSQNLKHFCYFSLYLFLTFLALSGRCAVYLFTRLINLK